MQRIWGLSAHRDDFKGFCLFYRAVIQVWFDLEIVVQGFVHDVTHSYPQKSWISG